MHLRSRSQDPIAEALGWFSIGLGLVEIAAPGLIARKLGLGDRSMLVRSYGAREIATGAAILASKNPTPWIWGRVVGDLLDIATLAPATSSRNVRQGAALMALGAVLGVTALDIYRAVSPPHDEWSWRDYF